MSRGIFNATILYLFVVSRQGQYTYSHVLCACMRACMDAGGLASRCFDAARSHEPCMVATWSAMGDASLRAALQQPGAAASAAVHEALQFYDHAQGLGGDVESGLGFALGEQAATACCQPSDPCMALITSHRRGGREGGVLMLDVWGKSFHT